MVVAKINNTRLVTPMYLEDLGVEQQTRER